MAPSKTAFVDYLDWGPRKESVALQAMKLIMLQL